ncbi:hypothetical protein [Thauera sp. Sel9]|uniref:hypothetical protein n=1 Tax=Thauera sp. Sel9 TaxID=2974299 RepID=UPI0021E1021C|nr:hypothetical protein [Thauera sp. Sel9]MCV2216863.1 hypothetical protein [Thauera sp. Sel9]
MDCPTCNAPDYHPDPSGPNGELWMICESCGLMVDHDGKVVAGEAPMSFHELQGFDRLERDE